MGSLGAFDFVGIRQSCWHQCEANPRSYNDGSNLPFYRDPKTEGQFQDVGKFFICVDVCEDGFNGKRIAFIVPMVLMGIIVVASILCCCFCKRCYIYRMRKNRQKGSTLLSETSSTTSSAASLHKTNSVSSTNSIETSEKIRKNWGGLYTVSAKMSSKVGDVSNRAHSSASVNSWIADEDIDQGRIVGKNSTKEDPNDKRARLMNTAQRLGKRLIELDKKAEEIETARLSKIRQRSLTQIETTNTKEVIE